MQSANTAENSKRIDRLFLRFAAIYGQVWRSQFKSDEFLAFTKKEWQEGLVGYDDNILDLAINLSRKSKELPPNLPQFIDFCKYFSSHVNVCKPCELPRNNNPEIAKTNLIQMKKILNMSCA